MRKLAKLLAPLAALAIAAGVPGIAHAATTAEKACGNAELLRNGSFEEPMLPAGTKHSAVKQNQVPGWRTDDASGRIEVWTQANGIRPVDGRQLVQLNPEGSADAIYQDVKTVPGSKLTWGLSIRARALMADASTDSVAVNFAATPKPNTGGAAGGLFSFDSQVDDGYWKQLYGWYQVPSGQTSTRVIITSLRGDEDPGINNLVDAATVVGKRC
jgi:hypothetical protein